MGKPSTADDPGIDGDFACAVGSSPNLKVRMLGRTRSPQLLPPGGTPDGILRRPTSVQRRIDPNRLHQFLGWPVESAVSIAGRVNEVPAPARGKCDYK